MSTESTKNKLLKEFDEATKLWQIHRIALIDLRKAERSPLCHINMYRWYIKNPKTCVVCMAGAVMKFRLLPDKIDREASEAFPHNFDYQRSKKLLAINDLRGGYVVLAALTFYGTQLLPTTEKIEQVIGEIVPYKRKNKKWWEKQWKLNRMLKKANI